MTENSDMQNNETPKVEMTPADIRRLKLKAEQYDRLMEIARERGKRTSGFWYHSDREPDYVHALLNYYDREVSTVITNASRFRDKVVTWMRAFQLNVHMVDGAYTHAEKGARLRGMDDLIDQAIDQIEGEFAERFRYDWFPDSLFGSTRQNAQLQRRVWEMEKEIEDLKNPKLDNAGDGDDFAPPGDAGDIIF